MARLAFNVLKRQSCDLSIWMHTSEEPNDTEWRSSLIQFGQVKVQHRGDLSRFRSLVVTDGGKPNPAQNKELIALVDRLPIKTSVVTNALSNPFIKGIAAVMQWTNPGLRFFPPISLTDALGHIDLSVDVEPIWNELQRLQKLLPPLKTMELIAKAQMRQPLAKSI